jgi:P2-related tail formation protein
LDEVIAPVLATLDCLDAYVDPLLAPEDFVDWLAGWVGAVLDENSPLPLRRVAVSRAAELHRGRGTVTGLRTALELLTGGQVEVADSGGVSWSSRPSTVEAQPSGVDGAAASVAVRVTLPDGAQVSERALQSAVSAAKPAHVVHSVEVVRR